MCSEKNSAEFFRDFVSEMEQAMSDHDERKACEWKDMGKPELIDNFVRKFHDFEISDDPKRQLVDIAAYAYFLWAKEKHPWRF